MTRNALALILSLALVPLAPGPARAQAECFPLLPGCQRLPDLLEDLSRELAPLMQELTARLDPYLRQLTDMLGDLSGWEAPEVLPNGDILIRRRSPQPPAPPDQSEDAPDEGPVTEPLEL
jgi:hypothetical protein